MANAAHCILMVGIWLGLKEKMRNCPRARTGTLAVPHIRIQGGTLSVPWLPPCHLSRSTLVLVFHPHTLSWAVAAASEAVSISTVREVPGIRVKKLSL